MLPLNDSTPHFIPFSAVKNCNFANCSSVDKQLKEALRVYFNYSYIRYHFPPCAIKITSRIKSNNLCCVTSKLPVRFYNGTSENERRRTDNSW